MGMDAVRFRKSSVLPTTALSPRRDVGRGFGVPTGSQISVRAAWLDGLHPTELGPEARSEHVLGSLSDYHRALAEAHPAGVKAKFDKLETSPFIFFRGTADLFYRDLSGSDQTMPEVLCNGDVHPENFGVMQGDAKHLIFGLNDFDEAYRAPFTWDLKRGATGLELAAREQGLDPDACTRVSEGFARGYVDAMQHYSSSTAENKHQLTLESTDSKLIEKLLEKASKKSRKGFLKKRVAGDHDAFRSIPGEIEPLPKSENERFEKIIADYRKTLGDDAPHKDGFYEVKAVAKKLGSGTGSIGLDRFYVLIEGKSDKKKNDVVLEIKTQRPSVLEPHVSTSSLGIQMAALDGQHRVARAHDIQVVGGDPLYGHTKIGDSAFLVRERSPFKARVDLNDLDAEEFVEYAQICGRVLAQAHARADVDTGLSKGSVESKILSSFDAAGLPGELATFAREMADQVTADHASFVNDRKALDQQLVLS